MKFGSMLSRHSRRCAWLVAALLGCSAAFLFSPCGMRAQAAEGGAPAIPGAVTKPPEWLLEGAPFDVKAYFAPIPDAQNAAPLYLDALMEFSAEVLICYPPSPERDQRAQVARDRAKRLDEIFAKLRSDPNSVPDAQIDALLGEYNLGFQKLYLAQQRPKCVFATGLGIDSLLPHAQAFRQVALVAELRVRGWLKRGNIDAALLDVATVLRLTRDLQPRGAIITQLVCAALTNVTAVYLVVPILNAPGLTTEQCDRLLKLLAEQDSLAIDGFAEGMRSDYLTLRMGQRQLVEQQAELRKAIGVGPEKKSITEALFPPQQEGGLVPGPQLDAALVKTPLSVRKKAAEALTACYRARLALVDRAVNEQRARQADVDKPIVGDESLMQVTRALLSPYDSIPVACGRMRFLLRAAECQAALKRWELKHKKPTTDLAQAFKDAGLPAVPLDPFNHKPLHAALVAGVPVVYSVGGDGKDDGGAKETLTGKDPGDIVLSLKQKPF